VGFTHSSKHSSKDKGFGLFSIKERLDQLGGHFKMESTPHHGTRMTIEAPLKLQE
jgi:signal transduction histidine kinase